MRQSIERLDEKTYSRVRPQIEGGEDSPAVFLDPWLTSAGHPLVAITDDLMDLTAPDPQSRMRSERKDATERRRMVVGNIVANLVHLALSPSREAGAMLAVSTAKSKPTRYDRKDYPQRLLSGIVGTLEAAGILIRHPYVFKQKTTTVEPTSKFLGFLESYNAGLNDIGRDAGGETIWLRARDGVEHSRRPKKVLVQYTDTEETTRLRSGVGRINEALNEADIAFAGKPVGPITLRRMFLLRSTNDPQGFDLNGRLAGGFWQTLKKVDRHLITIGGEDIVDLDYSGMFAVLAYLKATGRIPEGDPYAIPGLEEHRDGAKQGLLSLLNYSDRMKSLAPKTKALLPEEWTAWMLEGAMTECHLPIAHLFGKDIGVELMHTESQILMAVLMELADMGIPALPMHDGINVKRSDRDAAITIMRHISKRLLGVALSVKEKTIWRPDGALKAA